MERNAAVWKRGSVAGAVATLAMSTLMLLAKKAHVMRRDYPPRKITREVLRSISKPPEKETLNLVGIANHFGYGIAGGVVYSTLRSQSRDFPPPLHGAAYAMLVWAVSYLGWVPALGILPPPAGDQKGRVATMIAAHLVYGSVLGLCKQQLRNRQDAKSICGASDLC